MDWNCPWVKKDGSGLKQAVRYVDQPLVHAKTSRNHFYSEPKSILAPEKELTREELEALIAEHGQESRPESRVSGAGGSRPGSRAAKTHMDSAQSFQQQQQYEEQMSVQQQQQQFQQQSYEEHQRVSFAEETYSRDREQESQAPPDLEVIEVQPQLNFEDMGPMGGAGYEPSADELIDVLKNLENLAAANPGLYRTIVEQIQGSSSHYEKVTTSQQTTSVTEQQEMHYQQEMQYQQQEQHQYEQQMQQQMQYEEQSSMTQQVIEEATMSEESAMLQQQQQIELERQQRQQQQEMEMQKAKMY